MEDITPLVHIAEQQRKPGDAIVVYPSSGYAYGIATQYPIEKRQDVLSATDWVVKVRRANTVVLRAHRQDPERWAGPLDRLVGSSRIWLLGSHVALGRFPLRDWPELQEMITARGYQQVRAEDRRGAHLVLFVKKPTTSPTPRP